MMNPTTLDSDSLAGWEALGSAARSEIAAEACKDAELFRQEFGPDAELSGDWDSVAYDAAQWTVETKAAIEQSREAAGHDVAWELYSEALDAALRD